MSGNVYDRLQEKLNVEKREEGISALEIGELPPGLRKIMRLMLREVELPYQEIIKTVQGMPEADRLSRAELDQALSTLTQQGWLIQRGEGERVNYTVNLRRKPGSKLESNIWGSLESKLPKSKKEK